MINLFNKGRMILNGELSPYEQLRVNADNEYLAMCCVSFNPRFLAKIKRGKADFKTNKDRK
jgi:hypothetical protein